MTTLATTPGLFPLPDWAKDELIELKGKQKDDLISGDEGSEITDVYERAREEVLELQHESGLDRIGEGQLRWDDMLSHCLAVHEVVETGGLRRYFDNNNFYREPIVRGPLTRDGDVPGELEALARQAPEERRQLVLPGPHTLASLATDDYYDDHRAFREAIASFLAEELEDAPSCETCLILEPALATDPPAAPDSALEAIEIVAAAGHTAGSRDVLVHTYWGVPTPTCYEGLLEQSGIGVGLDIVTAPSEAATLIEEYGVGNSQALGIVDGQNTRLETPTELETRLERLPAAIREADRTYFTTNTELFYLPSSSAAAKLDLLGKVAESQEVIE